MIAPVQTPWQSTTWNYRIISYFVFRSRDQFCKALLLSYCSLKVVKSYFEKCFIAVTLYRLFAATRHHSYERNRSVVILHKNVCKCTCNTNGKKFRSPLRATTVVFYFLYKLGSSLWWLRIESPALASGRKAIMQNLPAICKEKGLFLFFFSFCFRLKRYQDDAIIRVHVRIKMVCPFVRSRDTRVPRKIYEILIWMCALFSNLEGSENNQD